MRRIVIAAALVGGIVIAARQLAPRLHARMLAACKGMFEQMPDDFPPKRMLAGIEEIRANTTSTLEHLEGRARMDRVRLEEERVRATAEDAEMVTA